MDLSSVEFVMDGICKHVVCYVGLRFEHASAKKKTHTQNSKKQTVR